MKVSIVADEWYPVFYATEEDKSWVYPVEVPDELLARHEKALKEFEEVQDELSKYYKRKRK